MRNGALRMFLSAFGATAMLSACGNSNQPESAQTIIGQLNAPAISFTGSGTSQVAGATYLFANSHGTLGTSGNTVTANFADPNAPLTLYSTAAFVDQINTGNCNSLGTLIAQVGGSSSNLVTTQISATGCSDQTVLNVLLDTTQVYDNLGYDGTGVMTSTVIVDLAPKVIAYATGNTISDGTGTTEGSAGYFSLSGDNSLVVTFSRPIATLGGTLSGCAATLGTPTVVANSNGQTIEWPISGFSGFSSGTTCQLNVGALADQAGNPEDPNDANVNMTVTFH